MDRLRRNGDHVLLGRASRDPFAGGDVPSGLLQRKTPVDFGDVFGGPPRRSSLYETRHGLGESTESCALGGKGGGRGGGEEEGERSRRWSHSVVEKPVFGGADSPAYRRHLGDDFFSDIFRGNESACSTPKNKDRDVFPSTPSSRVLSPSRPLPPTRDVLSGGHFLPAHLSYSKRISKSSDDWSFRSPTACVVHKNDESIPDALSFPSSPNASAPTNSSWLTQEKKNPRNGIYAYSRRSSLSRGASCINRPAETFTFANKGNKGSEEQFKKASTVPKAYSGNFYFSIYKWASKGVTLIMPSNRKERTKNGSRLGGEHSQVFHQADLHPDYENVTQGTQAYHNQSELEGKSPFYDLASAENDNTGLSDEVRELLPAASDVKSVSCDVTNKSVTFIRDGTEFPVETWKPESRNHHHLLSDCVRKGITGHEKEKESLVNDHKTAMKGEDGTTKLKQERENMISDCRENARDFINDAPATLEDRMLPSRAKGKVKEFVKIFSKETAQKPSSTNENQARRYRVKDEVKERIEDCASACVANVDEEDRGNYGEASSTPVAIGQNLKKAEQTTSAKSSGVQKMDGLFSEMDVTSVTFSEPTLDNLDTSFYNVEQDHVKNVEDCTVKEFFQDEGEVTEADLHQEETQMSDVSIREWSKGKEGNIRSLLSTLQYILWAGSGWKPVPLVDIIEGASVRKAYQKALLCLHPDKLQQKGAVMHQKFIAEKVFDILQEAWTHFNTPSSL